MSGISFNRPDFNRLVQDMRQGKIDCIIVKDLSRLGRNYIEAGDYLEKIFPFFGVRFISITDHYDSLYPSVTEDGLIIPLKNLINEMYSKDLSQKISTAFLIKQKQGKFVGNQAPYGYVKDPDDHSHLLVDEEARPVIERIFNWRAAGMTYIWIIRTLNSEGIPCPSKYKVLKGYATYAKSKAGYGPAVLSEAS